jgi:hypothetical protein
VDSSRIKIILFAFLAAVTIGCHFFINQYEKSGSEMREDPARGKIVEPGKAFAGSARRAEKSMGFAPPDGIFYRNPRVGQIQPIFYHRASDKFTDRFSAAIEPAVASYISKAGHFCFFLLFGLALFLLLGRKSGIPVMIHILLLAGATELAQFYIEGRTPLVWDFVIEDCCHFT